MSECERVAGGSCGVLNVLKPPGMTSHDVVAFVRRIGGVRRVGHTGTLDPGAAGVLPVCLGRATRISEYLTAMGKRYRVDAVLGATTSTDDGSGESTGEAGASTVSQQDVEAALANFQGQIMQRVPALSAKKVRGVHMYDIARSGVIPEERRALVRIHGADLVRFAAGRRAVATLDIWCSSGTYIRTICSDLGQALGCGGYMAFLLRTAAGPFEIGDSVTVEEIRESSAAGRLCDHLTSMAAALSHLRGFCLTQEAVHRLEHGRAPNEEDITYVMEPTAWRGCPECDSRVVRLMTPDGGLAAIARVEGDGTAAEFTLEKVFV